MSPLWSLMDNFVRKKLQVDLKRGGKKARGGKMKAAEPTTPEKVSFEKSIQLKVEDALKKRDTKPLVDSMARMLISEKKSSNREAGLLIDWLQTLDPELKQLNPSLRQQVLFSSSTGQKKKHLLTLLSHVADWDNLKTIVDGVLTSFSAEFEASAVLDFLSICVYLQMQWQCNDKHKPKHDSGPQDTLKLSGHQLLVVLDYAIQEIVDHEALTSNGSVDEVENKRQTLVQERMPFIISCLSDKHKATSAIDYLVSKLNADGNSSSMQKLSKVKEEAGEIRRVAASRDECIKELLLQIYMKLPQSLGHLVEADYARALPGHPVRVTGNTSVIDTISHFLLTALATTQHGRSWGIQMQEFEAAAR